MYCVTASDSPHHQRLHPSVRPPACHLPLQGRNGSSHPHRIDSDLVEVHLADAAAPTLIRENDKAPALYVLMPRGPAKLVEGCHGQR
jgi:hypothetical protein